MADPIVTRLPRPDVPAEFDRYVIQEIFDFFEGEIVNKLDARSNLVLQPGKELVLSDNTNAPHGLRVRDGDSLQLLNYATGEIGEIVVNYSIAIDGDGNVLGDVLADLETTDANLSTSLQQEADARISGDLVSATLITALDSRVTATEDQEAALTAAVNQQASTLLDLEANKAEASLVDYLRASLEIEGLELVARASDGPEAFTNAGRQDPPDVASTKPNTDLVEFVDAEIGAAMHITDWTLPVFTTKVWKLKIGQELEVRCRLRPYASPVAHRSFGGLFVYDKNFVELGNYQNAPLRRSGVSSNVSDNAGWTEYEMGLDAVISAADVILAYPSAVYVRPRVHPNVDATQSIGASPATTTAIDYISIRDVRDRVSAEADISSVESALTTESAARASADTALGASLTSIGDQVNAAEADITSVETALATETAARVSADTDLTAQLTSVNGMLASSGAAIHTTPDLNVWYNDASPTPIGWQGWVSPILGRSVKPLSLAEHLTTETIDGNLYSGVFVGNGAWSPPAGSFEPGRYIIKVTFTLLSGALPGAGFFFYTRDGSSVSHFSTRASFADDPDVNGNILGNGEVGKTYTFSTVFDTRDTDTQLLDGHVVFHLMNNWNGHGATGAKKIRWEHASIRPLDGSEVRVSENAANIATNATALATESTARAAADTALSATVATNLGFINANDAQILANQTALATQTSALAQTDERLTAINRVSWAQNPNFMLWDVSANYPNGYSGWLVTGSGTVTKEETDVFSTGSPVVKMNCTGTGRLGLYSNSANFTHGGYAFRANGLFSREVVIKTRVKLNSGSWQGAGFRILYRELDHTFISETYASLAPHATYASANLTDNMAGSWLDIEIPVDVGADFSDGVEKIEVLAFGHEVGVGGVYDAANAKEILFDHIDLMPFEPRNSVVQEVRRALIDENGEYGYAGLKVDAGGVVTGIQLISDSNLDLGVVILTGDTILLDGDAIVNGSITATNIAPNSIVNSVAYEQPANTSVTLAATTDYGFYSGYEQSSPYWVEFAGVIIDTVGGDVQIFCQANFNAYTGSSGSNPFEGRVWMRMARDYQTGGNPATWPTVKLWSLATNAQGATGTLKMDLLQNYPAGTYRFSFQMAREADERNNRVLASGANIFATEFRR